MAEDGFDSYRQIIESRFRRLVSANAAYSLRSFARDLKLPPSLMSDILNGKRGISLSRAHEVSRALELTEKESELFVLLVEQETARYGAHKDKISKRISELRMSQSKPEEPQTLKEAQYELLSKWNYPIILELAHSAWFEFSVENLARILEISMTEAEKAVATLRGMELLKFSDEGKMEKTAARFMNVAGAENPSIKSFHQRFLKMVARTLDEQKPNERLIRTEAFALNQESLPAASEIIDDCFDRLVRLSRISAPHTAVYTLGIQLVRTTKRF